MFIVNEFLDTDLYFNIHIQLLFISSFLTASMKAITAVLISIQKQVVSSCPLDDKRSGYSLSVVSGG